MACLVAKSMVISWKWDGRWKTQKIGRRRHWCLPQTLCPLGAHFSNGGIWGHGRGGMPFFFSDQGPVLKGGGDVGGEYPGERVIFLFVCLEVEMSLRAIRRTSSDAMLMGRGLMWLCRPLHYALSKAFCSI